MSTIYGKSILALRCAIALVITVLPFSHTSAQTFSISSTVQINNTVTLSAGQRALLIPDPKTTWNVWGVGTDRFLGYGGLTGTPGIAQHGDPLYPAQGKMQGALLVYYNNDFLHAYLPSEKSVLVVGPGLIGFGPNDNKLGDNQGAIKVTIIVNPTDAQIAANSPCTRL
jgi:hypothetical protein